MSTIERIPMMKSRDNHLLAEKIYIRTSEDELPEYSHIDYTLVTVYSDDPVYRVALTSLPARGGSWTDYMQTGARVTAGGYRLRILEYDVYAMALFCVLDSPFAAYHVWRTRLRHHWHLFKTRCAMTYRIWRA